MYLCKCKMKVLAIIFSVYVLLLTGIPCVDRPFDKCASAADCSNSTNGGDHGLDHCSPFCVCNCCGNHVVNMNTTLIPEVFTCRGELMYWVPVSINSNPAYAIWQPPKIG